MSVAACPRCEGEVSLPLGARAVSRVKCPLCDAEYSLSEVYAKLPPMLVMLDAPVEAAVAAGGISHGASAFDSLFTPSNAANGEGDLHLADGDEESFDFGSPEVGGAATATATTTKAPVVRPKRPPKNPVKEGIKIMVGGIFGLVLGCFILLWTVGQDVSEGVFKKPIGKVLPAWMQWSIPASFRHPQPAANGGTPNKDNAGSAADENADGNANDAGNGANAESQDNPADADNATRGETNDPRDARDEDIAANDASALDGPVSSDPPSDRTPKESIAQASPNTEDPGLDLTPRPKDPNVNTLPGDMPPGDTPKTEDSPFEIQPDATPKEDPPVVDPADMPEVTPGETPMEKPGEAEVKKPVVGLKVETPVDEAAVSTARSAASGALETLMPSEAAAKAKFTREKYDSYAKLCEYAQNASHSAPDVSDTNAEAAKMMVLMVSADETDNAVLGQLANAWLSKKRGNDGIVLSGKVTAVETAAGLTTVSVELPALGDKLAARTVTIVTRENAEVKTGDDVAAVGSVVEKPTEKIEGYAGADSQVIWGAWVGKRSGG